MGSSRKDDGNLVTPESYPSLSFDKETVNIGGIAALKPPELLGQHGVQGIGDHGHDNVEVHLYQDRGREGIEMGLRQKSRHT